MVVALAVAVPAAMLITVAVLRTLRDDDRITLAFAVHGPAPAIVVVVNIRDGSRVVVIIVVLVLVRTPIVARLVRVAWRTGVNMVAVTAAEARAFLQLRFLSRCGGGRSSGGRCRGWRWSWSIRRSRRLRWRAGHRRGGGWSFSDGRCDGDGCSARRRGGHGCGGRRRGGHCRCGSWSCRGRAG